MIKTQFWYPFANIRHKPTCSDRLLPSHNPSKEVGEAGRKTVVIYA